MNVMEYIKLRAAKKQKRCGDSDTVSLVFDSITLGKCKIGDCIRIANFRFIVLEKDEEFTKLILDRNLTYGSFGEGTHYITSSIFSHVCMNTDFTQTLKDYGYDLINFNALTSSNVQINSKIHIPSEEEYRKVEQYFKFDQPFWIRPNDDNEYPVDMVPYISEGKTYFINPTADNGIRPMIMISNDYLVEIVN